MPGWSWKMWSAGLSALILGSISRASRLDLQRLQDIAGWLLCIDLSGYVKLLQPEQRGRRFAKTSKGHGSEEFNGGCST